MRKHLSIHKGRLAESWLGNGAEVGEMHHDRRSEEEPEQSLVPSDLLGTVEHP